MDLDQVPWNRYIQLHRFIPSQRGDLIKTNLVAVHTQYIEYKLPTHFVVRFGGLMDKASDLLSDGRGFESYSERQGR